MLPNTGSTVMIIIVLIMHGIQTDGVYQLSTNTVTTMAVTQKDNHSSSLG